MPASPSSIDLSSPGEWFGVVLLINADSSVRSCQVVRATGKSFISQKPVKAIPCRETPEGQQTMTFFVSGLFLHLNLQPHKRTFTFTHGTPLNSEEPCTSLLFTTDRSSFLVKPLILFPSVDPIPDCCPKHWSTDTDHFYRRTSNKTFARLCLLLLQKCNFHF